jgi:hypothetical protein
MSIPENPDRRVVGVLTWIVPPIRKRGTEADAIKGHCAFSGRVGEPEGVLECRASELITLYESPSVDAPVHSTFDSAVDIPFEALDAGFAVFETKPGWYQIELRPLVDKRAWMPQRSSFAFQAAETRAEREALARKMSWPGSDPGVELRQLRWVNGTLWLHIDLLSTGGCGEPENLLASGWVPAYSATNDLTMWYYARGC